MKIIYIVRTMLHLYPPCLSQIMMLRDLGEQVLVIYGDCDSKTVALLKNADVETVSLDIKRFKNPITGKIQSYTEYSKKVKFLLKKYYCEWDLVWYGTADSCFALGNEYKKYPFVLNVLELYDENKMYRNGVGWVIKDAKAVISCEQTRADIMKMWWNLPTRPFVMPNKPYKLPEISNHGSIEETQKMISQIVGKKTFLYQGIIAVDRDLGLLAKAFQKIDREDLYLVLMGKELTDGVKKLEEIYPRTIYLGYVAAPYHLEVTRNAFIGVAYYQGSCLNNLFCAPNKIYEYSGVGVPILCNDLPGLRNTVGLYKAGECVDFDDMESLCNTILKMVDQRDQYAKNSEKMYHVVNNVETITSILAFIRERNDGV